MKPLAAISPYAHTVDHITLALVILAGGLTLIVWFLIVFFCIKYRRGSKADRTAPPTQARRIELGLSFVIFIFGLLTFIWAARAFYGLSQPPPEAHDIYVVGKQWMWTMHDPKTGDHINHLIVPQGEPVRLLMTSQDVIHSFYVPALRLKQDVLPGRYTSLWFTPETLGRYRILCSQYCGLSHAAMTGVLEVVSKEEYERSQTPAQKESLVQQGLRVYQEHGCAACHGNAHGDAPALAKIYGTRVKLADGRTVLADEDYLRRSILLPNADVVQGFLPAMPTFQGQITEDELVALIEFLKDGSGVPQ